MDEQSMIDEGGPGNLTKNLINNHKNVDVQNTIMKIVKTILLPRAMSTYHGQHGISGAFNLLTNLIKNAMEGNETEFSPAEQRDYNKYIELFSKHGIIRPAKSNINLDEIISTHSWNLTDDARKILTLLKKHPYKMDDYHASSVLWVLSNANELDDKVRADRYRYLEYVCYVSLQIMAEIQGDNVKWAKPYGLTVKEFQNLLKTAGKYNPKGKSEMPFHNAAKVLEDATFQSMLSHSDIFLFEFESNKIDLEPIYDYVKQLYSCRSLSSIESDLNEMNLVSQKVEERITTEKEFSA